MVSCKLPTVLLKMWNEGKAGVYKSTGKPFRKAYVAFVIKMSTMLIELAKKNPEVAATLKAEPMWEAYQNGEYKTARANETKALGGGPEKKEPESEPFLTDTLAEVQAESKEDTTPEDENKEPTESKYFRLY